MQVTQQQQPILDRIITVLRVTGPTTIESTERVESSSSSSALKKQSSDDAGDKFNQSHRFETFAKVTCIVDR